MNQFTDALPEVFETLGPVQIKPMFGGHGIWHDGLMMALVADDTLYLKTDALTRSQFDALGLPPFRYERRGGQVTDTSYLQAPETVFEDRHEAARWSRLAFEAALRMANAKPARKTVPRKPAKGTRGTSAGKSAAPAKRPPGGKKAR